MENEERIYQLYKARKEKMKIKEARELAVKNDQPFKEKEPEDPNAKYEVNMKDIIAKALLMRLGEP
jgi:hypothetical protein